VTAIGLRKFSNPNTTEFWTPERCHVLELMNIPELGDLSIARIRVEPGVTTELHALAGTGEIYVLLSGTGEMDDGAAAPFAVSAGDCVTIPADHRQRIKNSGSEDLVFLAVCTPRFVPANYQALDDLGAIASSGPATPREDDNAD